MTYVLRLQKCLWIQYLAPITLYFFLHKIGRGSSAQRFRSAPILETLSMIISHERKAIFQSDCFTQGEKNE